MSKETSEPVYRKEEFWFRFTNLDGNLGAELRRHLSNMDIESNQEDVVSIAIVETTDIAPLCKFLQQERVDPGSYMMWISLVTSSDHGGIELPDYVLKLVRLTDCSVGFSFVACLDE